MPEVNEQGGQGVLGSPASPVEGYVKLENLLGAGSNAERRLRSFLKYHPERCLEPGDSKPLNNNNRKGAIGALELKVRYCALLFISIGE
jgi:hypothetical protein